MSPLGLGFFVAFDLDFFCVGLGFFFAFDLDFFAFDLIFLLRLDLDFCCVLTWTWSSALSLCFFFWLLASLSNKFCMVCSFLVVPVAFSVIDHLTVSR
jgi:hypothetical protein